MARPATAARRYAEAAFELAGRDGAFDAWQEDLQVAAEIVGHEGALRHVDNPARPLGERVEILDRLIGKRVSRGVRNLVVLLAQRGRIDLLPAVAREFRRLHNRRRGVATALVTSAAPLSDAQLEAIRERVASMTGATVELETVVDERLIGGLTVRVGDQLLDASVRGRLERLHDQLVAGSR